jgi:hypothetical protein
MHLIIILFISLYLTMKMKKKPNVMWFYPCRNSKRHVQNFAQCARRKSTHLRRWRQEANCSTNSASGVSSVIAYSGMNYYDHQLK